jgi:hypothetical protein
MMRLAMARQANNEFWAIGFAGTPGPATATAKVQGFSVEVSVRDRFTSDLSLEFSGPPDAKTLEIWAPALRGAIEGNVIHVTSTLEANEVQQKLGPIASSPIGQHMTDLVKPTRYLPVQEATAPKQAKPRIYGLE